MRFEFGALPWEMLGRRPAMITLTYPGEWKLWVPDSRTFVRHREALKERWRRKYGTPTGVWVAEFQQRGAPHLHMYVALPDAVTDGEYQGFQQRTIRRRLDEKKLGVFEARRRLRAPSGEFAMWLRTAWWEIVGSELRAHHGRGVDIAAAYYSERAAATANRVRVAEYFWRESGKWAQKNPPDGFGPLKFYGRWGQKQGFNPVVTQAELDERTGLELRRVLRRMMLGKMRQDASRRGRRLPRNAGRSRGRDGLTVFGVDGTVVGPPLVEWAEQLALDKALQALSEDEVRPVRFRPELARAFSELEIDPDPVPEDAYQASPDDLEPWSQADDQARIDTLIAEREEEELSAETGDWIAEQAQETRKQELRTVDRWAGPRTKRGPRGGRLRP